MWPLAYSAPSDACMCNVKNDSGKRSTLLRHTVNITLCVCGLEKLLGIHYYDITLLCNKAPTCFAHFALRCIKYCSLH